MLKAQSVSALTALLLVGACDDVKWGAGGFPTPNVPQASGMNVYNCSAYSPINVYVKRAGDSKWEAVDSLFNQSNQDNTKCPADGSTPVWVPFSSGTNEVRVTQAPANSTCASPGASECPSLGEETLQGNSAANSVDWIVK